jgi:hypothetical protein
MPGLPSSVLVPAVVLALLCIAAPATAEAQRIDGEPAAATGSFGAPGPPPDPRLLPPPIGDLRASESSVALRWPQNPAVGGVLGGAIGCAAGYALAWLLIDRESTGNDPGWGCIIGGSLGMVAGSGMQLPSRSREHWPRPGG